MLQVISRVTAIAVSAAVALTLLSGCSSEDSVDLEDSASEEAVTFGPTGDEEGTFVVPLPDQAAKDAFIAIASKSAQRFYELGIVETYVFEEGEESFIYDPNYDLGPVAVVIFETENSDNYGIDFIYDFAPFSVFMAIDLVRQQDTEIVDYNVTRLDEKTFVVSDTQLGSRTYYVEDNLIVGWNLIDNDYKTIGRSYVTYLVGEEERVFIDSLVEQSSDEQLEAIFNPPSAESEDSSVSE